MRRFGTALLVASSASLVFGVTAVPADAGTFQTFSLSGHATQVKTSTGRSVDLQIFAFKLAGDNNVSITVTMSQGSARSGESHLWSFRTDTATFDYNNGTGTLDTGNLPMNFGMVDLTFHKSSQQTTNCPDSGSTTNVRGSLQGSVNFDSKSDTWGRAHDNSFTFDTPNFLSINDNCTGEPTTKPVCSKGINWNAPFQANSASASGFTLISGGKSHTTITGSRITYLDNTYSVYRSDSVFDVARSPVIDGNKLTVRTKKGTRVSGKGVFSGGSSSTNSQKCRAGSKTETEHTTSHNNPRWTSPHGIKFNQTAFGDFKSLLSGDNGHWSKFQF